VTTHPENRVVGGLVAFEGHQAIETLTTYMPVNSPSYTYKVYSLQTGPAELTEYGSVSELVTGTVQSRSKSVYTPPFVQTLTAVPGDTKTISFTAVTTNTLNGVSQAPTTTTLTTTGTFIGFEQVTIPAGTFNACRFEQQDSGPQNPATTRWVLLGHGIELKASTPAFGGNGASVLELTTLLINGSVPQ